METKNEDLKIRIFSYVILALGVAIFIYFCWKACDCLGKTGIVDFDKATAYLNLAWGSLALIAGTTLFFLLIGLSCVVRNTKRTNVLLEERFGSVEKDVKNLDLADEVPTKKSSNSDD